MEMELPINKIDLNNDTQRLLVAILIVFTLIMMGIFYAYFRHGLSFESNVNSINATEIKESTDEVMKLLASKRNDTIVHFLTEKDSAISISISSNTVVKDWQASEGLVGKYYNTKGEHIYEEQLIARKSEAAKASESTTLVSGVLQYNLLAKSLLLGHPPIYSFAAREQQIEGKTTVKLFVNPDGLVNHFKIIKQSGFELLDSEVEKAVELWMFKPELLGNEAKEFVIEFDFQLE